MGDICRVCKRPLDDHALVLRDGVAHTVTYLGDRRSFCSVAVADHYYLAGEITRLMTVIRSLRNRAGRIRNRGGAHNVADALDDYSDKITRDRNRLIGHLNRYYPWRG